MALRKEDLILIPLVAGVMMGAIDSTIVVLALPTISDDLKAPLSLSIWIILAYLLVAAVSTTQFGRLGDMISRKTIFNSGMAIFTLGSFLCGVSSNIDFLIAFRFVQAAGGSMMQANSGSIIADNFPPNLRGRAYGYTSVGWNSGATLGIVLGGIITTLIGWRYIFYINVPVGIISLYFAIKYIIPGSKKNVKLDVPGVVTLTAALSSIAYAATDFTSHGLETTNETLLSIGFLLLVVFIFLERTNKNALLPFHLFQNRVFNFSIAASFLQSLGYLAVTFIVIMYLQGLRGLTPLDSSLLLVPGYVLGGFTGPIFGKLSDRIGARTPATLGMFLMMIAVLLYMTFNLKTPVYYVIPVSIISGLGSSMFFPANNSAVMASSPAGSYGAASGLLRTMANIGMLGSFVLAITVSTIAIPRYVAFEVFAGVGRLVGGLSASFLTGIHTALEVSFAIIAVGMLFSFVRGKENRSTSTPPRATETTK
ncbi:multidrug resistance protein [Thermoplasma volcanium GSS1]|uniref:Multidrug resistance protein n=1 Tax=Thermoplasma volcanium (strain ATCC 51530 / DSM 4299 / JCM 9571 / NBRC 15438 / GSS1) TaxID=273116 RepID=Q978M4_THEVO|nr:MFS transporter [Thermoplasma volcanium]BAB60533.1 multidrug resistance protein [Thermoplasma volcanium GSS1]